MNVQIFLKLVYSWLGAIIPSVVCLIIASLFVDTSAGWLQLSFSETIFLSLAIYMPPSFVIVLVGLGISYKLQTKVDSNSLLEYLIGVFLVTIAMLTILSLFFGVKMLLLTPILIIPPIFSAIIFWYLHRT